MMRISALARFAVLGALLVGANVACSNSDNGAAAATAEAPRNENVNLPPVPDLPLLDIPRSYPDGTHSVMGVLIDREKLLLSTITISGMVVDVYECENPGDAGEDGLRAGCLYPHFYIADTPDSPKRILVTGYNAAHYEPQLQPMTRYRFTGHYSVQARGFSSSESGLLSVDTIEGSGVVPYGAGDE